MLSDTLCSVLKYPYKGVVLVLFILRWGTEWNAVSVTQQEPVPAGIWCQVSAAPNHFHYVFNILTIFDATACVTFANILTYFSPISPVIGSHWESLSIQLQPPLTTSALEKWSRDGARTGWLISFLMYVCKYHTFSLSVHSFFLVSYAYLPQPFLGVNQRDPLQISTLEVLQGPDTCLLITQKHCFYACPCCPQHVTCFCLELLRQANESCSMFPVLKQKSLSAQNLFFHNIYCGRTL